MENFKLKRFRWLALAGLLLLVWLAYLAGGGMSDRGAKPFAVDMAPMTKQSLSVEEGSTPGLQARSMAEPMMMDVSGDSMGVSFNNGIDQADEITETDQKIIKNGDLTLKVPKTDRAAEEIGEIAKNNGGEVVSSNFYERIKGEKNGHMVIKVPADKFESTLAEIKKIGSQVINEVTNAQDVTAEFIDLEARLKNKKSEEEAFKALLDRAGNNKDLLDTTRELARVRGEIERLEGQKRFMSSQTEKSTISVDLREDVAVTPVGDGWRPWEVAKESFKGLVHKAQQAVDWSIKFLIEGLPSLIFIAVLFFVVYRIGHWAYRKFIVKN
ncbi:MAG TPA: DUF4349 domain-containing protein [Candidatus Moranbacteria bacterium]|nr:DUF4349 domain-containing protein [Candidatus Moranbacteria bacterium]